jgi:serine/threonine protein kinase
MGKPAWEAVRNAARGQRTDYRLEPKPLAEPGGQGIVFRGVHKSLGVQIALKRVLDHSEDAIARMRREVDVASALKGHRRVMPVLDSAPDSGWFVMPLARHSAADRQIALRETERLRRLVTGVCQGLAAAHDLGWVHRDIKPENILYLDGRWVVADWGLGRRPRGHTSLARRTRTGIFLGTERFAAPELAEDAHDATFAADVYSLGQLIGWAVTGQVPLPFTPLIPASGLWRGIVRDATQQNRARRPQTIKDFLNLVEAELNEPPSAPANVGEALLERIQNGDGQASVQLWRFAAKHSDDYDLYIEVLSNVSGKAINGLTVNEPELTHEVAKAMHAHLDVTGANNLPFASANAIVKFLLEICETAGRERNWALLEDAADAMFAWDAMWDQWNARDAILVWLRDLDGEVARVVAGALRRNRDGRLHFEHLADDRQINGRLRAALAG